MEAVKPNNEQELYQEWIDADLFKPDGLSDRSSDPYTLVLPPPNVTGNLHIGHALNVTIQDILWRYHKGEGRNCLWIPGTE